MNRLLSTASQWLPGSVSDRAWAYFEAKDRARRAAKESRIPKVPLTEAHVQHCEALLNRAALLQRLPAGGAVAELGVARGDFSAEILTAVRPEVLHLVDVWATDRYHDGLAQHVRTRFAERIDTGQVRIHRRLSLDAADRFADGSLRWVYIDTDHSYRTTRDELRAYAPKVEPGGLLAGHDYTMGAWVQGYRFGVVEAVHEFCVQHRWHLRYVTLEPTERPSFALLRMGEEHEE